MKNFFKIIAKIFLKIIVGIFVTIFTIIVIVFGLRGYNDYVYRHIDANIASHEQHPNNIASYPTNIDDAIDIKHIEGAYLNGFSLSPKDKKYDGVIVTFGGSEGGPMYDHAARIAKEGYEVLSLFFFGMPNQQPTLADVPVEYFEEIEAYIFQTYGKNTDITIVAGSKGAEYALLLASEYPSIKNLALYAPSSHIFMGLDFEKNTSSWTKEGKPLPYINVMSSDFGAYIFKILIPMMTKSPIVYRDSYSSALQKDSHSEEKRIKIEKTNANIALFVGTDDHIWNSLEMGKIIQKHHPKTQLFAYEGAGHLFFGDGVVPLGDMRLSSGGTRESNEKAFAQNKIDLMQVLNSWHQ